MIGGTEEQSEKEETPAEEEVISEIVFEGEPKKNIFTGLGIFDYFKKPATPEIIFVVLVLAILTYIIWKVGFKKKKK